MTEEEVEDPLSDDLWNNTLGRAKKNTVIYREIFACDPDDKIKNSEALIESRNKINPKEQFERYSELKVDIKGHIVEWPIHFMDEEDLSLSLTNIEGYLPETNFL